MDDYIGFLVSKLKNKINNYIFSTTARYQKDFKELPEKEYNGISLASYMLNDPKVAKEIFTYLDGKTQNVFIDIEKKQSIDLWKIAKANIKETNLIPVKPNDATLEAAYQLILNKSNYDLADKSVLIYGAGNIGSKLALRLAEVNIKVYLTSRDMDKVNTLAASFNAILPAYSDGEVIPAKTINDIKKVDYLITFISADKIIGPEYLKVLKPDGIAIDGGINNFTKEFLNEAHNNNTSVLRVDVRLGTPQLLFSLFDETKEFFNEVQGSDIIDGVPVVAGGIIGQKGDIVVDRIKNPTQVYGVANGYGGLIDNDEEYRLQIAKVERQLQKN